jgi:hypothetical protein
MSTKIEWVPGHEEVEGSEDADQAAKEAAKSEREQCKHPKIHATPPKICKIGHHKARNQRRLEHIMGISSTSLLCCQATTSYHQQTKSITRQETI